MLSARASQFSCRFRRSLLSLRVRTEAAAISRGGAARNRGRLRAARAVPPRAGPSAVPPPDFDARKSSFDRAWTESRIASNASMMCARYGLTRSPGKLAARLGARPRFADPFEPRYNIAPTQPVLAITNAPERPVVALRWGLVPYWAESASAMKLTTFNARIETFATAPSYRDSTRSRRCVILADGFYEWRRSAPIHSRMPIVLRSTL